MSERPYDQTFEQLAAGYFDQVLDDAQLRQFSQLLREDDQRVHRFAELAQLHQMIESEITYRKQAQRFNLTPTPSDSGAASALVELASLYEDSLQQPMDFATWRDDQASRARAKRHRLWRNRFMVGGLVAALFALAGVLAVILISSGDVPQAPIADQQTEPLDREVTADRAVATLTNTHNATWAEGASAPGSQPRPGDTLAAGQRLNLIAGFAEITTKHGAIAILEAPATIELINNNAIRLHTGKLVGICETESSKGFLVRTPHLDITDLGTWFGVDTSSPQATTVHVYQGEVALSRPSRDGIVAPQTLHLIQGQAARVTKTGEYQRLQADTTPFAAIKPSVTPLHGSGVGIERGQEDARWTVVAVDGQPLASPHVLRVSTGHDQFDGLQIDPSIAQWLAWDPGHTPNAQGYNTYRFQTTLDLPASFDPRTSTLVLDYHADSRIRGIWINGQQVIDAPGGKHDQVGQDNANGTSRLILDQGLLPGRNLIQIDVENYQGSDGASAAAVGLIAAWQLHEYDNPLNQ